MNWHEFLMQSASIVTAFATVGGAMLWAYKKLVIEPDQRVAEDKYGIDGVFRTFFILLLPAGGF